MATLLTPRIIDTLLFIALQTGPPRLRRREVTASLSFEIDWAVILNAVVLGLGALWVFARLNEHLLTAKSLPRLGTTQKLVLLLVGCLSLSAFFSPAYMLSFYKTFQLLVLMLFSFLWIRRFGIDSILTHLFLGYLVLEVILLVAAVYAPELVMPKESYRLRGESVGDAGAIGVAGLILALCYPIAVKPSVVRAGLVLSTICLLLSQSRTSYIAAGIFFLLATLTQPPIPRLRYASRILLGFAPLAAIIGWMPTITGWVIRDPDSISDMSDRIPLWTHLLSQVWVTSPWIGFGIYGYRREALEYNHSLGSAHSAFVEMVSAGGIVGGTVFMILFGVLVVSTIRLFLVGWRLPVVFLVGSLLLAACCAGITGEEMVIEAPANFLFWTLVSLIPRLSQIVQVQHQRFAFTRETHGSASFAPLTLHKG